MKFVDFQDPVPAHRLEYLKNVQAEAEANNLDSDDEEHRLMKQNKEGRAKREKRHFVDQKRRHIDGDMLPNPKVCYRLLRTFFSLQERDYFGGRSLLIEIKPSTDSCKAEIDTAFVPPSQLAVIADSADVEVLIMDRQQVQFFPHAIQEQIMSQIQNRRFVERPFDERKFQEELKKFDQWDKLKQAEFLTTIAEQYNLRMGVQLRQ